MDGKNNDREFEQFLRENADNHRLYPADSVWENIHARLHPKKRWPLTAILLLAFTTGSITWFGYGERSIESVRSASTREASATTHEIVSDFMSDVPQFVNSLAEATAVTPTEASIISAQIPATKIEPAIAISDVQEISSEAATSISSNKPTALTVEPAFVS